jgi:hypothetical protein
MPALTARAVAAATEAARAKAILSIILLKYSKMYKPFVSA